MKKIILLSIFFLCYAISFSQVPHKFNYQAVIRDASGNIRSEVNVAIQILILQGLVTNNPIYIENHNVKTSAFGLVNLALGGGVVDLGKFNDLDWAMGPYFIKVKVDGVDYGSSEVLSVPYALYANKAGNGFSGNYNDLTNLPVLFDGTWNSLTGNPAFAMVATSGNYHDLLNQPLLFSGNYNDLTNRPVLFDGTWVSLTGKPVFAVVATSGAFADLLSKPTTLDGYGITNAMSTTHPANIITSVNISNWNTAYGWGNHIGLYRSMSYVPSWSEITAKPTTLVGFGITDGVRTEGDQTIIGNKTFTGTTTVSTPINSTDAATKAYVDNLKNQIKSLENSLITAGIYRLTDIDGNKYNVVEIGDQVWMAENLKVTTNQDGVKISPILLHDNYGAYYEWSVVESDKLCPEGWRVPYNTEWEQLVTFLGGSDIAGGKLKAIGTVEGTDGLWYSPNTNATNETNFTALPGGYHEGQGSPELIINIGYESHWWSRSDEPVSMVPYHTAAWMVDYNSASLRKVALFRFGDKVNVRCIKDEVPALITFPYSNLVITRDVINQATNLTVETGGSILDDRGFEIIQKGVCWNYLGSPERFHEHTNDGSGSGSFTSVISIRPTTGEFAYGGLCIRAYATTSKGTGYGNEIVIPTSMWE